MSSPVSTDVPVRRTGAGTSAATATTAAAAATASWDAEAGVWVGERALADDGIEIPRPLHIFGYGSLMFRPQDSFAACERFDGVVYGWRRMWAQRSCDHRGEPHMPGLVVTVLSDEELAGLGLRAEADPPSAVHGVAYRIPEEQVQSVLDELDFREKGGYTRAVVDVHLTGNGGSTDSGQVIKALLYTANAENPNFHQPATVEEAAHIVAWSRGPSGENKEYLFEVDAYLRRVGAQCRETFVLTERVKEVLSRGLDRRAALDARHRADRPIWRRVPLVSWGSNQHGQLGVSEQHEEEEWPSPRPTGIEVDVAAREWDGAVRQLAAGGGHSALVTEDDRLYLWGWNDAGQLGTGGRPGRVLVDGPDQVRVFPRKVGMVALGHAHTLVLEQGTGRVYGLGANGAGEATGRVGESLNCREEGGGLVRLALSAAPGQGDGDGAAAARAPAAAEATRMTWCAAGVRHSAGVTLDGALVTWGSPKHGEGLPVGVPSWRPDDGVAVAKAWCGWQHTVALDDRGRVWTLGGDKHGQLGLGEGAASDPLPRLVAFPGPGAVEVVEVACGWSHVLARTSDGQVWGWGRNNFGQLGLGGGGPAAVRAPVLVFAGGKLPNGAAVRSIRAGTESSLAVGEDGSLWACGWNEHGNLGTGDREDRFEWTRVPLPDASPRLLACGGAHVFLMG